MIRDEDLDEAEIQADRHDMFMAAALTGLLANPARPITNLLDAVATARAIADEAIKE